MQRAALLQHLAADLRDELAQQADLEQLLERGLGGVAVGDVKRRGDRFAACRADRLDHLLGGRGVALVVDDDGVAHPA